MHKLPAARRGPGVHLVRIAALSTALTALTALVVADVTAAESDEPTPLALTADTPDLDTHADAPVLLAAIVPDAIAPQPSLDELPARGEEKPKKQRRRSKLKFGRFEGY